MKKYVSNTYFQLNITFLSGWRHFVDSDISWTLFFKMGDFSWTLSKGDISWTLFFKMGDISWTILVKLFSARLG